MTIQEFNKAMNGIDDRFLSAWEEQQEQVISFPQDKETRKAKRSHRRLWVLVLAACLVIALAITAYATMEFADWDTNGQGMFVKSWSTDEITLVISSEQRTRGPEALSGSCRVLVHNQKTGDKDFEVLPLNLTAAPEPEGDVKIFHPLSADSVPGMKFQDGTLTKTLRGYRLQLPFTVTDENTWKTYWKVYCEDLDLYGLLDFETGNMILDDIPTNDFSSVVIQILDDDSNIAGTLEVREYIG